MRWAFAAMWLSFCVAVIGFGVFMAAEQQRKLKEFLSVEATVLGTEVESRTSRSTRNRSTSSYYPIVRYEYVLDGVTYQSHSVFPTKVARSGSWGREWAAGVIEPFEKSQQTQAFYDPKDPGQAFLLKQPAVFPYFFILLPTVLGALGSVVITMPAAGRSALAKRRVAIGIVIVWYLVGVSCVTHYWWLAGSRPESLAAPVFGVYVLLGLIPAIFALPSNGIGGRCKAAGASALVGAFLGFWIGLLAGMLAGWMSQRTMGGPYWGWYGVQIGATLFALSGFFTGKFEA